MKESRIHGITLNPVWICSIIMTSSPDWWHHCRTVENVDHSLKSFVLLNSTRRLQNLNLGLFFPYFFFSSTFPLLQYPLTSDPNPTPDHCCRRCFRLHSVQLGCDGAGQEREEKWQITTVVTDEKLLVILQEEQAVWWFIQGWTTGVGGSVI